MRVFVSNTFHQELQKLSIEIQAQTDKLVTLLVANPFDPLLHTKKLKGPLHGLFSFRVGIYRAIFRIERPDSVYLLSILHRKDIYR